MRIKVYPNGNEAKVLACFGEFSRDIKDISEIKANEFVREISTIRALKKV